LLAIRSKKQDLTLLTPRKNKKTRLTFQNGEVVRETISEYISLYQYVTDSVVLEVPFNRDTKIIKDRQTGEVLGEIVSFAVYPGWLDSRLLGILGFTWIPPRCDGNYSPIRGKTTLYGDDLIKSIIKPNPNKEGD